MEETASYCSGSPGRTTVYTPVTGGMGECHPQVMGQSPYFLGPGNVYEYDEVDHHHNPHSLSPHIRQAPASSYQSHRHGLGLGSLHDVVTKPYEQPPYKGFCEPDWSFNKLQAPQDWTITSTRFLKLSNVGPAVQASGLFAYLHTFGGIQDYNTTRLSEGVCTVAYLDLRDAVSAYIKIKTNQEWSIQYCSQIYCSDPCSNESINYPKPETSKVICTVASRQQLPQTTPTLYTSLSGFGTIYRFTALRNHVPPTFIVAFRDLRTAADLVDTLDDQYLTGFHLRVALHEEEPSPGPAPPLAYRTSTGEYMHGRPQGGDDDIWSPHPVRPRLDTPFTAAAFSLLPERENTPPSFNPEPAQLSSSLFSGFYPSSRDDVTRELHAQKKLGYDRSQWEPRANDHLRAGAAADLSSPPHSRCRSSHSSCTQSPQASCQKPGLGCEKDTSQLTIPGKNIIDLDRIVRGLDTRTTVMLRNIPNKVDQQTLKEYIDETSRGLYNFLYLRIDFRNICNVGYAFINFLDPLDIVDFVKAKSGTRWNKFNSEKVLDVTYANIQGIDQLVEKFRNSSVMDQDPAYRPKLFYATGPLAGAEMEFPPANNILKKCRSVSAAQQIGLFAPKLSAVNKGVWRKRE